MTSFYRKSHPLILIFATIASLSMLECSKNTYPVESLSQLMLSELRTKRIVMLGDSFHGHRFYEGMVTGFLNYWVDAVNEAPGDTNIPHRLWLILEVDDSMAEGISRFCGTGDILPFMRYEVYSSSLWGGWETFTVDRFEFLTNLRTVSHRLSRFNAQHPRDSLSLVIAGGEVTPPIDPGDQFRLSEEEFAQHRFAWFAEERDSLIAAKAAAQIDRSPAAKGLFFYGTAHLQRELANRAANADLIAERPTFGYCLAHYLDLHFGRNNVAIFQSRNSEAAGEDGIQRLSFKPTESDYLVRATPIPPASCNIQLVPTKELMTILFDQLEKARKGPTPTDSAIAVRSAVHLALFLERSYLRDDPSCARDVLKMRDSLQASPIGPSFSGLVERLARKMIRAFDAVKNLSLAHKWLTVDGLRDSAQYCENVRMLIQNIEARNQPDVTRHSNVYDREIRLSQAEKDFLQYHSEEVTNYLINRLLWTCSNEEAEEASHFLGERTGKTFKTPSEWNAWFTGGGSLN